MGQGGGTAAAALAVAPRRLGRPAGPSERVRTAVLDAVARELERHGYASFSVERVAVRAGVHRGTVYRHWPSRQALIVAAVAEWHSNRLDAPDTGSWAGDVRALAGSMAALYEQESTKAMLRTMVAANTADRELREALLEVFETGSDHLHEPVRRAKTRGEVPAEIDERLVLESLSSPLLQRCVITDVPLDPAFLDWTVHLVLAATAPTARTASFPQGVT
jgi:AcrR family transcriptional regulator